MQILSHDCQSMYLYHHKLLSHHTSSVLIHTRNEFVHSRLVMSFLFFFFDLPVLLVPSKVRRDGLLFITSTNLDVKVHQKSM